MVLIPLVVSNDVLNMVREPKMASLPVSPRKKDSSRTAEFVLKSHIQLASPAPGNSIVAAAMDLRRERMRKIYERVLYPTGLARQLYQEYFSTKERGGSGGINVDAMERELAMKGRPGNSRVVVLQPVPRVRDTGRSQSQTKKRTSADSSPQGKRTSGIRNSRRSGPLMKS